MPHRPTMMQLSEDASCRMTEDWKRNRFSGEVILCPVFAGSDKSGFRLVTIR